MTKATHTPGRDDENGQCRYCGRDNRGHEHEMCIEDCPYEIARAEAPAMLEALREVAESPITFQDNPVAIINRWRDAARAILARIDGEG